jgi:hypothetical protein
MATYITCMAPVGEPLIEGAVSNQFSQVGANQRDSATTWTQTLLSAFRR